MVYNKADFKKHIETLQIDGFKLKSAVQAYLFTRKFDDRIETITISYKDYAPHGFYISSVSANVFYPRIEAILEEYGLDEEYKTTIGKSFQDLKEVNSKTFTPIVWIFLILGLIAGLFLNKLSKPFKEFLNRFKTSKEVEV